MTDPEPRARLGSSFKHAVAAMRRMRGSEPRGKDELRDAQYSLLFCLKGRDPLPSSELALAADLSPASATEMLDGLVSAGLVHRTRSLSDRRVVLISLTDRGRALVEEHHARMEPRFRAAFADFSDEQLLTAAAVLDRLGNLFDELAEERRSAEAA